MGTTKKLAFKEKLAFGAGDMASNILFANRSHEDKQTNAKADTINNVIIINDFFFIFSSLARR